MNIVVKLKPLSINSAWRGGRRFRTNDYLEFERSLLLILPKQKCFEGPITIKCKFYLKNYKRCDTDNYLKCLFDVLQKANYFKNDNQIYKIIAEKIPSEENYLEFEIEKYE